VTDSRHQRGARRARPAAIALAGIAAFGLVAACAPGSDSKKTEATSPQEISTDVSKAGKVTLTVWDQEVRGGQNAEITQLKKEFQDKYPNVTINRVSKSFTDLKKTLKLALSGKDAPDVVEANQGYPDMGTFVRAGYLLPLDGYATAYGWDKRYPRTLLNLNSFSSDGVHFGSGNLYGLSQTGEYIGIYYNKEKLASLGVAQPKTWTEFVDSLDTIKSKGELPIQFGNLDKYPAIHLFGVIQAQTAGKQAVRDLVFGRDGASWSDDSSVQAASTLADWAKKGYLTSGANGLGYDDAWKDFAKGKGAYLITGTWLLADLQKEMGAKLGFMLPPPGDSGSVATTGGQGLSWSVTSKSKHPDVAAAYLDFITNAHAADVMTQTGNLPVVTPESASVPPGTAQAEMVDGWATVSKEDGLVPYLDYTTPTFYDTITAELQKLIGGQSSPEDFGKALEKDATAFRASN
jgi:raffinose/stachyose/melibiose transport system substrate-binding protein